MLADRQRGGKSRVALPLSSLIPFTSNNLRRPSLLRKRFAHSFFIAFSLGFLSVWFLADLSFDLSQRSFRFG
jgi:hypothetical protein